METFSLEDDEYCGLFITQEPSQRNELIREKSGVENGEFFRRYDFSMCLIENEKFQLCVL